MSPLRTERVQRHWSQRELAERVEADVATVKRWERGATVPGPYFRLKLTALFGKSEEALELRATPVSPIPPSASDVSSEEPIQAVSTVTVWTVPYRRNAYFTGRDELFRLLDEHLTSEKLEESSRTHRVALTQTLALTGLGGIGKTQFAVEYAYRMHEQGVYSHTFWINAASEEAILTSFTEFATFLPASNETDSQKLVEAIKRWLELCSERWLLIFDNADNLSSLQQYFPRYGNGSILLTTRAHAVGTLATSIEVEKMGFMEGTYLLLRRAQRMQQLSDDEMNAAEHLVVTLDYFPLALEQAGAYIEETGCTFDSYLHLYHTHRSILLARRGMQTTNYPDSVATTWSLSIQKVKQANPAAVELLQVCAFLAPDHIPEELLRKGATYWSMLLQQAVIDPFAFNQLLEALLRFSLIKRLAEDHLLSIHRLVQVVQVEMLEPEEQCLLAKRVVRAVNHVFPLQPREDASTWSQCQRYLEQVQACQTLIQQHMQQTSEAGDLLERAGNYLLYIRASYFQAEMLYQQALYIREKLVGTHHPETARILHNLGFLYCQQGKYKQAESYSQQALAIKQEQLGGQHTETAKTLNNLGILSYQQGKYEQAKSYWQQSLAIKQEQLGDQHPSTAGTLDNLGLLFYQQEKYEQAESYFQRTLAIREEQLGVQHFETARTLDNLGLLYSKQGKHEQAEAYYHRALAICEGQLRPHHPITVEILTNLAELYRDQYKYEQAELLFTHLLVIQEHILTENYPDLARTLHGFARLHEDLGTLQTAAALYQRALPILEQVYGLNHLKTIETREHLQMVLHLLENEEKEVQQDAKQLE